MFRIEGGKVPDAEKVGFATRDEITELWWHPGEINTTIRSQC